MSGRGLRVLVLALALGGVVAWYAPASAFNYGSITGTAGRAVTGNMTTDQKTFLAMSVDTCPANVNHLTGGTCTVVMYNNATSPLTLGISLQNNNFASAPNAPTWKLDGNAPSSGTASTSSAKAHGTSVQFTITWTSGFTGCAIACTYTASWQINATSATNQMYYHQDHWTLSIPLS